MVIITRHTHSGVESTIYSRSLQIRDTDVECSGRCCWNYSSSRNFFEWQLFKDVYRHLVQLCSVNCFSKINQNP